MSKKKIEIFDNIGIYNKELITSKLAFFKDCHDTQFLYKKMLENLKFNFNFGSDNYRYGVRYFNPHLHNFAWKTSNENKQILVKYFNNNSKTFSEYYQNAYITNNMLDSHLLGCKKPKRKYSKYSNHPIAKKYYQSLLNIQKCDNKIFGLSQQFNSNMLWLDLDVKTINDSAIIKLKTFLSELGIKVEDLTLLEANKIKGGIHCMLTLPFNVVNENFYKDLTAHFKKMGIKIECTFINNILRLPLSFEYFALKKDSRMFNNLKYFNKFNDQYEETDLEIEGTQLFFDEKWYEESFDTFHNNLNFNPVNSTLLNTIYENTHNVSIMEKNKFINHWKSTRRLFEKDVTEKDIRRNTNKAVYPMEYGSRYETMKKVVPFLKFQGYSLDETVSQILNANISSKDLKHWNYEKLYRNIQKFYNKIEKKTIQQSDISFISNRHLVPQEIRNLFVDKDFVSNFTRAIINNINHHRNYIMSVEKETILTIQMPILITELVGRMIYHIENPNSFKNKRLSPYSGFQISNTYMERLIDYTCEELNFSEQLGKSSIQYLKRALIEVLKLKEIKNPKGNERNWVNGSCKSYMIRTTTELFFLIKKLNKFMTINSIYKNGDNFSYIILNILLKGKPTILDNCEENRNICYDNDDIPIPK